MFPLLQLHQLSQTVGEKKGVWLRFLKTLKWKQIGNSPLFFESQLFTINNPYLVLIAVIYHPPKHIEHFISVLANFLSLFYFSIHICSEDKPLVNNFLNVIDSFHLTDFVAGPTHQRGHTLDLVLGHGLSISVYATSFGSFFDFICHINF